MSRNSVYENYPQLENMGGRSSRQINHDPGPCPTWKSDIDKKYHISDHWGRERGQIDEELARWLDFRWHQFKIRENQRTFNKYDKAVHMYLQEKAINWVVKLHLDQQTKLDEWKEYYIYEHRKRRALVKKLNRAKRELGPSKKRMMRAKRNGSVGISPTALSQWWGKTRTI